MRKSWMLSALLSLSLLTSPMSADAAKIVVDAGHGGYDPGAIGVNGLQEKTVNYDISMKLRDLLVSRGYEVVMSRDTDVFLSLKERVEFTNAQNADLFVSIHANSYPSSNVRGTMVLYYDDAYPQESYPASEEMKQLTPQSRDAAQKVLDAFVESVGTENRGLLPSAVYVVRMGTIPSILVETAFLSNASDAALLATPEVRDQMAEAIAKGIEAYLPPDDPSYVFPDTKGHWAREAILRLKEQGIVEGVGKKYEPNRVLTRAEWMTLLGRLFPLPAGCGTGSSAGATVAGQVYGDAASCSAGASAFKDVNAGHWAFAALDKAVKAGVLEGYADGTLRPDRPVTRAEVAAMLQRLAGGSAAAGAQPFEDVPRGHWAAQAVAGLKAAGWVDGVTATRFMPEKTMTRAEAAALLDRYVQSRKQAGAK
ncbi:N-acetylmuramoyl-L-alanine amidase [Paenibacillus sp. GD4]|uniref:N-acetylmuramoyl-L-alanine amidase n=1 Tax=Paenibacillus sp. GD4 TaxID=3068890 RepID=UPI002796B5A1|nr:N-acetylmuramoyl-L-alanine amidase [Paenibacillus sp. GD4]MDQ1912388.1 N-acetylmuramoyl-L-alanine amidase [Paenibacillus sp. GD4]